MDHHEDEIIREITRTRLALDEKLMLLEQKTQRYRPTAIFTLGRLILAATVGALAFAVRGIWHEQRANRFSGRRSVV